MTNPDPINRPMAPTGSLCLTCGNRCSCPERISAARAGALLEAVAGIKVHNGALVIADNLRWASTHEALSRSFICDVLNGLADALDRADHLAAHTDGGGDRG